MQEILNLGSMKNIMALYGDFKRLISGKIVFLSPLSDENLWHDLVAQHKGSEQEEGW